MNQKEISSPPPRPRALGRPVKFDQAAVIDGAVDLFWERGFEDTSLEEIVTQLGISRSTLYNSFGGKDGLYAAALERYHERVEGFVIEPLRQGRQGISDLLAFTDRLTEILTSTEMPAGCLVLNWAASEQNAAATHRYLSALRYGFEEALQRAAALDEIGASTVQARAGVLISAVVGLNVVAHAAVEGADVGRLCDDLAAVVRGWASDRVHGAE